MHPPSPDRLEAAYQKAFARLLAERTPEGYWVGELSTSALSTAVAVSALSLVRKGTDAYGSFDELIRGGVRWLAEHQNDDGGWGDTVKSFSNISTTMLCRAAFHLTDTARDFAPTLERAEKWLAGRYGPPAGWPEAVRVRYGKDRTFAVPILTTCALAGLVDWREVASLPFELACFPQRWFRFLRLHVVSYALPALIAIGQCVYHHRRPRNPLARLVRSLSRKRSLRVLEKIQPSNGGFLEATPLTGFVTLSLAACGLAEHPVVRRAVGFLTRSARPDGSWPIDTNLSTWVTTLSINALAAAGELQNLDKLDELRDWLLEQQYKKRHPYTGADPGGWAWTPLQGGVPDADDTPGALLALSHLNQGEASTLGAGLSGVAWLSRLQNRDGGWPTFCRGWGHLPFDRSGPDLTAHVLRALAAWKQLESDVFIHDGYLAVFGVRVPCSYNPSPRSDRLIASGSDYLRCSQRPDGSWLPLWFGNQHAPDDGNPTYGTARVLAAYRDLDRMDTEPARRGIAWLLDNQNDDGGWGGLKDTPSSVEETALAVEALLDAAAKPQAAEAVNRGLGWLVQQVESGGLDNPAPIGFYFAKLWYFEKLYPIIFTVAALGRARRKRSHRPDVAHQESTPAGG